MGYFIAFIAGGCVGFFLAAMCCAASKADDAEERYRREHLNDGDSCREDS